MHTSSLRATLLVVFLALVACGQAPPPAQSPTRSADARAQAGEADKTVAATDGEGAAKGGDPEGGPAGPPAAIARGAAGDQGMPADDMGIAGGNERPAGAARAGVVGAAAVAGTDTNPIPVTTADPSIGKRTALVTLVEFSDFECPFCRKASGTVAELRKLYGPDDLRIVWKNNPLPFHKDARPAAETAMALFEAGGDAWFWKYHDAVFNAPNGVLKDSIADAGNSAPIKRADIDKIRARGTAARKVDADMDLGKRIGVTGTPAFFINGVFLSGAQPVEKFRTIIDAELAKAKQLVAAGTDRARIYEASAAKNFVKPETRPSPSSAPPEDDKNIYLVPIAGSPVRGKPTALTTLVVFSDFQCPFCMRVNPTIEALATEYGDKLRVVFKHQPLPFHKRAEPAAELAIEARAQKGDAGFWKAHDLLWAAQGKLEDADLEGIAKAAGLNVAAVTNAVAKKKHERVIAADQELADLVQATGTPHFFINGRRLVGAQPLEKFKTVINEEIAKAEALVAKGTPAAKVYETIQKQAVPYPPLEKKTVPAPSKDSPFKGAANAKVTIQVFSDFECPFCKRSNETVTSLLAAYPGRVRVVWRNMPLPFHKNAMPAAEAALEAYAQKGDAGFWKMHDLLFEGQPTNGLGRASLEQYAAAVGLDPAKFTAALDSGAHKAAIERDKGIADTAGISGTPSFVINGYFISGAQPLSKFRRVVEQALKDAK